MTTLYQSNYLHLFYEDYIASSYTPYGVIQTTKEQIRQEARQKIQSRMNAQMNAVPLEVEGLFNLNESDFDIPLEKNEGVAWNDVLGDFDSSIGRLKELTQHVQDDVSEAESITDNIINSLKKVIDIGKTSGGITAAAVAQIESGLKRLETEVRPRLHYLKNKGGKRKQSLINAISDVQSNVSGYLFELAQVYASLAAHGKALGTIINIGGSHLTKEGKMTVDPNLDAGYRQVQAALKSNAGTQSRADAVFVTNVSEDGGVVSGTFSYSTFQDKNVKDISRIKIATYTLGELGIESYYDSGFLANTAGGLAGDKFIKAKPFIDNSARSHRGIAMTQTQVDEIWANIKDSVKVLGVADAIAGAMNANLVNKIDYYVVRQKGSGKVRVIPSGIILQKILDDISSENWNQQRVNFIGGKNSHREKYWTINYSNYVKETSEKDRIQAALERSDKAYDSVLDAIRQTKVQISVNFSEYFI